MSRRALNGKNGGGEDYSLRETSPYSNKFSAFKPDTNILASPHQSLLALNDLNGEDPDTMVP